MSLANKITLARSALIPPILILLFLDKREAVLALFLLACLGDVLDGMVARWRREVSSLGKALDPAVDKVLYLSLLASLTALGEISLLAMILFLIPQLGLAIGALFLQFRAHIIQGARMLGKVSSLLTFVAMVLLLLLPRLPYGMHFLYLAIGATYLASLDYLRTALWTKEPPNKDKAETLAGSAPRSEPARRFPDG